jgi:hypothetical protein
MAQSYTRQSTFSDGDTITAALFNNEYNQLVNAFTYSSSSASSTGHRHDGTAGHGGNIHTIGDLDFLNKIVVDSTNNRWGVFVEVSSAAVEQIRIQDGAIVPVTDNDIDLGTSSLEFKDAYFDGTITTDLLTVSGATNLDGAIQVDNTITVGVDDTGYDVKFFGDTASAYMLWDASADDLVLAGAAGLDVAGDIDVDGTSNLDNTDIDGTLAVDGTTISLDATTSLNIDNSNTSNGITIGTATSGVPVSIGHTTSEVTVNDNLTVTGTLTLGSGAELTEAELEMLDGITAGTVAASKAVVVDSNKDAASFRNITLTGELDAGSLDVSGDADIDGTLETDALSINGTAVTATAAELNILDGVTASATDINLIDGITNGTVIASKAIITDANKDISGGRNITISGELDAATLDISGDADIDGTLEADAYTVDGTALNEYIADTVGAMVSSNTETNITVTYEDGDNTLDFVIGTLNQDTTGTADNITVSANNSTDETVYPIFVDGATGSQGAESDTGLTYNPSTGVLTSTSFTGNLTGNVTGNTSGTAATVTGAAQSNITSLGTLTTLTVDNVIVNGTTIGHTSDTDLMTLADGVLTVAGEVSMTTLDIGGTNVTSTAAELNILDGVTSTAAELNILDGATVVVGELNYLDLGATAVGTAIASKAVILDSNKDYTGIRNLTITGELDAATLDISGDVDIDGTLETDNLTVGGAQGSDGQVLTSTGSGVNWETPASGGANSINDLSDAKTFGTSSIMIGDATTGTISGANYNTGVGVNVFEALTTGDENVAMGYASLNDLTTGSKNTTIGATAGAKITTGTDNTAMGADALKNVTTTNNSTAFGKGALLASTAEGNTAVGKDSQLATTTGYRNVSMGKESLMTNTTGDQNVAIGNNALELSTTADNNTALGYNTLNATTTGATNVAVGSQTLAANTTASDNTGVGYAVLLVNTTGANNTGVGVNSLQANTTASENVAVGKNTMLANTTGAQNVAVGANALDANTTAANNTAIGYNSMTGNTTGTANVAVGTATLVANTTSSNNTAVGYAALNANTTGTSLTAVGKDALIANTTGDNNIAIGRDAGQSITEGSNNIVIGVEAYETATTANGNIAIGKGSLKANTTGTENVAIGHEAGNDVTTGAGHTLIGYLAGDKITTASQNTAVGSEALGSNTGGGLNTAIGYNAMLGNTTGGDCTAVGARALDAANAADGNTAVGSAALGANTTGAQNTALGTYALDANTTTHYSTGLGYDALTASTSAANTGVGAYAGTAITTGDGNTCVGFEAGDAISTGTDNVMIGKRAGDDQTTGNGNTVVGSNGDTGASGATGRLVLGSTIDGTSDARATLGYNGNVVEIDLNGSDESWAASSDERLKENVQDATAGLQFINELRPITYQWKKKKDVPTDMPQYEKDSNEPSVGLEYGVEYHGFIAQEVKAVIDKHDDIKDGQNIWKTGDDEVQKIAKGGLIPMLVKAIQELSAEVEQLKSKIEE